MFTHEADTAFILGAGFSAESKLPTTREFADSLLDRAFMGDLELAITNALIEFLRDCFRWEQAQPLLTFEDMFTMIDLSAGTGHSLGRSFTPKRLRAIRRMLIYRLFSILDRRFEHSANTRKILETSIRKPNLAHFVVLNWDIVLEKHLYDYIADAAVDYCVDISAWDGPNLPAEPRRKPKARPNLKTKRKPKARPNLKTNQRPEFVESNFARDTPRNFPLISRR